MLVQYHELEVNLTLNETLVSIHSRTQGFESNGLFKKNGYAETTMIAPFIGEFVEKSNSSAENITSSDSDGEGSGSISGLKRQNRRRKLFDNPDLDGKIYNVSFCLMNSTIEDKVNFNKLQSALIFNLRKSTRSN